MRHHAGVNDSRQRCSTITTDGALLFGGIKSDHGGERDKPKISWKIEKMNDRIFIIKYSRVGKLNIPVISPPTLIVVPGTLLNSNLHSYGT